MTLSQVRIYTANRGKLDEWVDTFRNNIVPGHQRVGIKVVGAWVNRPQGEFLWVREFEDAQDMEAKMKAFGETPERQALGPSMTAGLAKLENRDCERVYEPSQEYIQKAMERRAAGTPTIQFRLYTVNRGMMDDWIKFWSEGTVHNNEKYGIHVLGAWAHRAMNEFVWVRSFQDQSAIEAYNNSPERAAAGSPMQYLAKLEVREVEQVYPVE